MLRLLNYLAFQYSAIVAFAILHILNDITENIKSGAKSTIGKTYKTKHIHSWSKQKKC
jgi:hypothetical protein